MNSTSLTIPDQLIDLVIDWVVMNPVAPSSARTHFAVVGSSKFPRHPGYGWVCDLVQCIHLLDPKAVYVSGRCPKGGPDVWGEYAAKKLCRPPLDCMIHEPDWDTYGKRAGFIRNGLIAESCDFLFAFWNGKSNGTKDTVKKATKLSKPVVTVYPSGEVEVELSLPQDSRKSLGGLQQDEESRRSDSGADGTGV